MGQEKSSREHWLLLLSGPSRNDVRSPVDDIKLFFLIIIRGQGQLGTEGPPTPPVCVKLLFCSL